MTGAGNFTITRNTQNGLPEAVTGGALSLSRTFNGYGEVSDQGYSVNGQDLTWWNLTRDDNGRIIQKIEAVDGTTSNHVYTYDSMGRLLMVTRDDALVEEYDYDANGTRIYEMNALRGISGRSFTYSDEDHLLTAGDATYRYNPDGYLTTKTVGTEITSYSYSSRGELLSVALPDGKVIEYVHDPLGRRIAKKVDGVTVAKYLWQGHTRLLAVYDGSDNLIMRFEYADGRMPLAMTSGGSTYYLTYDQVGSLRVVADASGNVVKRIEYDSFGNIIADTDPALEVPFGFAGGLHDRDAGLVRFGKRDYDPDTGRWTAKDPIGFMGGDSDLYGYCLSDPINLIDPTGQFGIAGFAVGVAAGAYGGFVGGMSNGNVATGIISGIIGGIAGGAVGIVAPHLSAMAGGIAGGIVGGIAGGVTAVYLDDPCGGATFSDYANAAVFGGTAGGLTGAMGGAFTAGAQMLGATGVAVDIASAMTTAPVGIGLGMGISAIP